MVYWVMCLPARRTETVDPARVGRAYERDLTRHVLYSPCRVEKIP